MPVKINQIRKAKVKQALLNGVDAKNAVLQNGYAMATAHNATQLAVVKQCKEEILRELRASDITPEFVIKRLNQDRDLAIEKQDYATATKVDELLGKYIALFTEKREIKTEIINQEEQTILNKYS